MNWDRALAFITSRLQIAGRERTAILGDMGGFRLGLTGALEVNTKEGISANSNLIIMWGAKFASQPNTTRHVRAAQNQAANLVTIDLRRTEVAA